MKRAKGLKKGILAFSLAGFLLLGPVAAPARAEGEKEISAGGKEEMVVKERKGIRFKLPADWPIEEKDGALAPIPAEDYMARKFSAVSERLERMERRLAELEKRLNAVELELRRKGAEPKSVSSGKGSAGE